MKSLLQVGVEFLSGSHSLQFTGLVLINKIIDAALGLGGCPEHFEDDENSLPQPMAVFGSQRKMTTNDCSKKMKFGQQEEERRKDEDGDDYGDADEKNQRGGGDQRSTSTSTKWATRRKRKSNDYGAGWVIDYLCERVQAGAVLSLVLNAITLHRRVVGTRFRCTPSVRVNISSYFLTACF